MELRIQVESPSPRSAVKTVYYSRKGAGAPSGRVSVRTLKEMIAHWEIGPDDTIRIEGETAERRVRESPELAPLDEMLQEASSKVARVRTGKGRRAVVLRELEMLLEYAEHSDRVYSVACLLLGCLRYAENPALSRGLFLKALERGYPVASIARNNLAVAQIRLGEPAGRDNLILASNDPQRPAAALMNLARLLQHLQSQGEKTAEIANIKDLVRVARAEWLKTRPAEGSPASFALFLCEEDIPASFTSETRALSKVQGQIEEILAEGEDCLRQGRLEQALAHAARAASDIERARDDLDRGAPRKGLSPLRFLSVRLARLEKATQEARKARESQTQLDVFRSRLHGIEESLKLKVPPADLIHQAEILLDASRNEGERAEAMSILQECQDAVARHLLETANELLSAGEKDVASGLLQRALTLDSRYAGEIRLRIAGIRRDELEEEICRAISAGSFDNARSRITLLRTIHPVFGPVADRLENEVRSREAGEAVERAVKLLGSPDPSREAVLEARRLLDTARGLDARSEVLDPLEADLRAHEARHAVASPRRRRAGRAGGAAGKKTTDNKAEKEAPGFSLEPADEQEGSKDSA